MRGVGSLKEHAEHAPRDRRTGLPSAPAEAHSQSASSVTEGRSPRSPAHRLQNNHFFKIIIKCSLVPPEWIVQMNLTARKWAEMDDYWTIRKNKLERLFGMGGENPAFSSFRMAGNCAGFTARQTKLQGGGKMYILNMYALALRRVLKLVLIPRLSVARIEWGPSATAWRGGGKVMADLRGTFSASRQRQRS